MRVTILGSGTSTGVPMIGCSCPVCTSTDPQNRRTRASAAVESDGKVILIDTATDLRFQALRWGIKRVDAVLYTHAHADHIHGMDELRSFNLCTLNEIPCYGSADTLERLRGYFQYIFNQEDPESLRPFLTLHELDGEMVLCGQKVIAVPLRHGNLQTLGYRINDFAYLTDASFIPEDSWPLLEGLKLLVIDALRPQPHPTHFSLAEALAVVERVKPGRTALTHLSHQMDQQTFNKKLPIGVELAYDGLVFEL
jgi:phosphoribosyl 1,2-cyclic phosphate phosphodiesterase